LEHGENLEENQRNLLQITERFFQAIIGSSSDFPPQLRSVCHCLYQGDPQIIEVLEYRVTSL
ncbi:Neurofibromin 1, partial [Ilyodon furcidens]